MRNNAGSSPATKKAPDRGKGWMLSWTQLYAFAIPASMSFRHTSTGALSFLLREEGGGGPPIENLNGPRSGATRHHLAKSQYNPWVRLWHAHAVDGPRPASPWHSINPRP